VRKVLKVIGTLLLLLVVVAAGVYGWASMVTSKKLRQKYAIHTVDFPIPFPLPDSQVKRLRLKPEAAEQMAREQAIARGEHLMESRYACKECHGGNLGGGVMVDAAPVGRMLGPNLTTGKGSRTISYRAADWDRAVRHGVKPDSTPMVMPSQDFRSLTDQELSDVVMFIRSHPPVDSVVPPVQLGPVLKVMVATGKVKVAADIIDHNAPHQVLPPDISNTMEYGRHFASICTGCHREDFSGGPIIGGPPDWPPARNITPAGLSGWTFEQFRTLMREAKRPDGTMIRMPMANMAEFAKNMKDEELQALWTYLQSVKPVAVAR
jgi:mono/diheme cytochrome c family protein